MASNRPRRQKQKEVQETKTPKGKLNNMELVAIGFFCIAFLLYGISKCSKAEPTASANNQPVVTEEVIDSSAIATTIDSTENNGSSFTGEEQVVQEPIRNEQTGNRKLYVLTDSLRLRKEPSLGGGLITYLNYGEEVMDLGEHSVLEKLRISPDEVRTAPWIKVKTKKGKIGWAFGAYLQFYPAATRTNITSLNNQ